MKRITFVTGICIILIAFSGCSFLRAKSVSIEDTSATEIIPSYSGSKARVAVADFEVKAAKAGGEIGAGLQEMLVTALVNSGRFVVLERQALNAIKQEQELAASPAAQLEKNDTQKGKVKSADLIIAAAVTEFEPEASGGRAGIGGGGGAGSGQLGGLLGATVNRAHMALDVRIIDASTTRILAARRLEGQATDITGAMMKGFFGSWNLGAGLSAYANTPLEKAIRICIVEAVRYISRAIPANYYRH